jgi:hypothetical protein
MSDPLPLRDPVARDFVDYVLSDWNGDLGFGPGVLLALGSSDFDVMDLLSVIHDGATTSLEKESPHDTLFDRFGITENGKGLCVTLSFDPNARGLTIVEFSTP